MTRRRPTVGEARALIEGWFGQALRAVDPERAVERAVTWDGRELVVDGQTFSLAEQDQVIAIAVGKAAVPMARGLQTALGDRIDRGIALTKDGHGDDPPSGWTVVEASHPVPDERGTNATRGILDAVSGLGPNDLVIVLVSGGGSALLESPRHPLGLAEIQDTTRLLLRAGAPIQHLNAVRSELSEVKGGGLRRAIGPARCISLILSDVLGNDPSVIASGPTIAREPDRTQALKLLERYGVDKLAPRSVVEMLTADEVVVVPPDTDRDAFVVIGDNELFIDEIARLARKDGFRVEVAMRAAEGEASDLAGTFLQTVIESADEVDVIIGGGEATVTVRGDGTGGRNTEFALAAAIAMDGGEHRLVIASLASDGQDGVIDAAGAIVDRETVARGRAAGLDAGDALTNNDSGRYLEQTGDLVCPGPTGTNVNDTYIAVRVTSVPGQES